MDNSVKNLENLLYGDNSGFEIALRMGQGIDAKRFNDICDILGELKDRWSESAYVPKEFMQIFLEFRECCENSLALYDEEKQIEILQQIDQIFELVNEIICD